MILIVGCGFLGSYLLEHISEHTDEKIVVTTCKSERPALKGNYEHLKCDITDMNDLINLSEKCKGERLTVFYFAACHNVDYVYEYPEKAEEINIAGLERFFDIMPQIEKFFFASTDCVYGEGKNLSENSALNPVNEYGIQKMEAEKIVVSKGFTVLRYPFMLGPSLTEKPHFYDAICSKLREGETVEMIDGMFRSVISYSQAAKFTFRLSLLENIPQIINVCSDKAISKYETACVLAERINAEKRNVKRIAEKDGEKFFKDRRASCTAMDNTLLKSLLKTEKIVWEDELS